MREKFEIYYSGLGKDGQKFKPAGKDMLVMNNEGIFFLYNGETYYPSIRKLSDVIGNYDVKWRD